MKNHPPRLFKFQNDQTARLSPLVFSLLVAGFVSSPLHQTNAQTPGVLYTWPTAGNTQDWLKNFGSGTATLSNPGGALVITETSATAGASAAFSDGFNTIRDTPASFGSGCCGGLDLTGLGSLEFDMGHNGVGNVNVQFFVQASPGSNYVPLGLADVAVAPGIHTYSLPLSGLTAAQIAYIRTIGINIRDHASEGNLTWTIQELRSVGTPLTSRTIADHDGGAADFDGVICNFDCGAVSGGNGGQNNSGMSIVGNALEWVDLGGGPGVALTYGNGTQESGGGFNARPVDLSNYDLVTFRMKATGADSTVGVQFYMQTGSGFNYQSANSSLPVDGAYHDLVFPLAGITTRNFVDTSGINLFSHASDLVVDIDSVIYSVNPPTPCIQVVKLCNYPPNSPTCFPAGTNIDFVGYVTNCGNIRLTNVTAVDCRPLLGAGLLDANGLPLSQPLTLDPGQAVGFRGSFAPTSAETCAQGATNCITVRGTDITAIGASVTNSTTTTCAICATNPSITVTKACASPIVTNVGSSLTVTGMVCNTGGQDLTNVYIVDSQPGLPTSATNVIGLLPAGQCSAYSFTYMATSCDPNHDTVTALGDNPCGGPPVVATASADCFLCCPGISIQTVVGCLQPGATCPPSSASYAQTATGVKGTTGAPTQDNPAFCYIIVVRNTGHDPLTNIVIHDDQLGALGTFPGPLAVGGTITISNLRTNWGATTTNFTSVTAQCGGVHANGAAVGATTNAVATVLQAGIACQKLVSVNGGPPAQSLTNDCSGGTNVITWYVTATNTGMSTLCNIFLIESGIGPDLLPCGAVNIALTNCLAPGQGTGLIPVCQSVYGCAETNIENSIRVIGIVASISNVCAINITGSNIVAESQCAASVTLRRGLTITKACASGIVTNVGSSLTVTGMVCNLGDQDLTNIIIFDSQPGLPLAATNVIDLLPAGQCSGYSFTYTAASCDPNHDVVTAFGTDLSGALVGPVTASADCFLCCPGISIQTLVGCLQPGAVCPPSGAGYSTNATGVKGDTGDPTQDDPAFCYIVVVRNTGHDSLTNIVIIDDQLGALGTFPGPLAVGGTITISNLRTNWDTTTTNTSSVSAQCGGVHANGAAVSASASAVAAVVQAGITVQKLVSVNGSTPVQVATPACGTIASNITWYVNVTNTSEAVLCNIQVTELGLGPDLLPCGAVNIALTNCLAPGQETGLIPLCTFGFNTCVATNLENSVRVTAQVAAISNACTINITGSNIVVQSQCSANLSLCCVPAAPEPGCRVTGGGRQDSPETCPDDVRFVTHGGQVGGPFGSSSCVVTLDQINGNRCIQGRWTHVRHNEGGLEGNFHARIFDTLACACLGDSFANTNTCVYEQGVVTNGICNPVEGNGHSNGRLGPANKIAFTGVGEWVDPEGRRQPHSALFRVDIEDRGEPGGAKPIDGDRPADRYRIRIWVLTPDEVLRLNDPTDGLINIPAGCDSCTTVSRNAIRACLGITFQDGVCGPNTCATNANDQTCFTLPGSIPVRLPDIDDGGELKNGNEQIHPQLKICP